MAQRIWKVARNFDTKTKKIYNYFVTDAHDADELSDRPEAAIFPISTRFDLDLQNERAERYAEYLNKLEEAARVADEQNHLVDILRRP